MLHHPSSSPIILWVDLFVTFTVILENDGVKANVSVQPTTSNQQYRPFLSQRLRLGLLGMEEGVFVKLWILQLQSCERTLCFKSVPDRVSVPTPALDESFLRAGKAQTCWEGRGIGSTF